MNKTPPLLAALRHATEARHRAVERRIELDRFADLGYYARVVATFERFLNGWEPKVACALPPSLRAWFADRSRLALAGNDLRALGIAPARAEDPCAGIGIRDYASALGSMYVIEGSALGGRVLAREAKRHLGLDAAHGAAYFHGWGEQTGARWQEFLALLARESSANPGAAEAACRAACETFDSIDALLAETLASEPEAAA